MIASLLIVDGLMILTACCCILFHLYSCNYSPVLGPYLRRAISKYDVDVIIGTKIKNVLNLLKVCFLLSIISVSIICSFCIVS